MNDKKVLIYHHTDMDGYVSASQIVDSLKKEEVIYIDEIPVNYPEPDKFPYPEKNYDTIFIVDVSFTEDTKQCLLKLKKYSKEIIWLDHHQSSVELMKKNKDKINEKDFKIFITTKVCASVICYLYNQSEKESRFTDIKSIIDNIYDNIIEGKEWVDLEPATKDIIPEWIYYVDQWDTWKHKDSNIETTIAFKHTFGTYDMRDNLIKQIKNDKNIYNELSTNNEKNYFKSFVSIGKFINKYVEKDNKEKLKKSFETELEEHSILCVNSDGNSMVFGDKINDYDMVCLYHYDGKENKWSYSIYSKKGGIDCSKVAEKFGGGGHPGASGFSTKKCLF